MIIGAVVVGALRLYCVCIKRGHSWQRWEATDFTPAMAECSVCGKEE